MTGNQFSGVDLDRLADYVGGALDGTPAAAEVERLLTDDPRWRAAYAALAPAAGQIRADLAALGAEPMPPDVADRLDAALRSAAGEPSSHRQRAGTPASARGVPPSGPARGGPAHGGPPSGRPPRRKVSRRWVRWAGVAAVAAAVVALGGVGANVLGGGGAGGGKALSTADRRAEGTGRNASPAAPAAGQALSGGFEVLASGSDYRRETLAGVVHFARPAPTGRAQGSDSESKDAAGYLWLQSAAPAGLDRLTNPAARDACLRALTGGRGLYAGYVGPATVQVVDYARFEGWPVLVVFFVDARGVRWVSVAGPSCGEPSAGADVRYATRVG